MLTQVHKLIIIQLHIFSINFINVLSYMYYRFIRYLVFPALFPSISMVVVDYICITSLTEYSQSVRLLLKETKSATMNIFRNFLFCFKIICKSRIKLCFHNKSVHYN